MWILTNGNKSAKVITNNWVIHYYGGVVNSMFDLLYEWRALEVEE